MCVMDGIPRLTLATNAELDRLEANGTIGLVEKVASLQGKGLREYVYDYVEEQLVKESET